jgi:hypothetical protein
MKIKVDKPCKRLKYCPYGSLVEKFPLRRKRHKIYSCKIFGHDCPVFHQAEAFIEEDKK